MNALACACVIAAHAVGHCTSARVARVSAEYDHCGDKGFSLCCWALALVVKWWEWMTTVRRDVPDISDHWTSSYSDCTYLLDFYLILGLLK